MDISPNNELYAAATDNKIKIGDLMNGSLHVWPTMFREYYVSSANWVHATCSKLQRDLRGHVGEITTLQFFPSGQGMI